MKLKDVQGEVIATGSSISYDVARGGWAVDGVIYTDADRVFVVEDDPLKVSPVEFQLLFTAPERVAIRAARATDPVVEDFMRLLEDPRLTHVDLGLQSTQAALDYLVANALLAAERKAVILQGQVQ